MKRKLLLFFAMLCVSIGAWAAPKISGSGTVTLSGFQAGELKKALNGESVEGLTGPVENLKNATKIVFGDANLNDDDLSALTACTKATQYDMSSATLAEGATISSISAGPAIETVVLPNGLSKADVNAAGAALTTCNPLFGSCLSLDTEIGDYIAEYVRDLTNAEGYPKCLYTNTEAYNAQFEVSADLVSDGTVTLSEFPVVFQHWDNKYKNPFTNEMVEVSPDDPRIFDGPNGNKFIMVDFSPNTKTFNAFTKYKYQYTDENGNIAYTQESDRPDEDMKIDINYNQNVVVTTRTGVESTGVVIAYVNTEGSLYKATRMAITDFKKIGKVVISGHINNGDISQGGTSGNSDDPQGNNHDSDAYESNGAISAFNFNNTPAPIKSVDMSDAVIDDYKHLRVLNAYGANLESVVFPKTVTRIPNYCCYSLGNNGCQNLANVVFPTEASSLTIGAYAFHHTAITSLLIPGSVTEIGDNAFATCENITDIEMEALSNPCHFGNYVFANCSALKHVTLSEKVENIGDYQFNQCELLESIRIPSTCETIGSYSFYECFSIHQMTIPEGVKLIKINAFELAGITDLYIMANSIDKLPKIYAMSPTGDGPSTFSYQRTTGNNTSPQEHRGEMGEGSTVHYDEAMSWYQEDQSGPQGLGTGNCLTAIHYPESMKPFFEAIDVTEFYTAEELAAIPLQTLQSGIKPYYTPAEYVAMVPETDGRRDYIQHELNNVKLDGTDPAYNFGDVEYQYLPQTYAVDAFPAGHDNDAVIGPDADGRYYPNQHDFWIRMAAGATSTQAGGVGGEEVASAWGWRQFPLASSVESIGEIPFEKEYDDTWYTMAFPWKMEDNQLFMAFNQKCEIVEFIGAEVLQDPEDEYNYNLVFHFDEVAKTYYMDDAGVEYNREKDGDRKDAAGHQLYVYTSKDDPTVILTCPEEAASSSYKPQDADPAIKEAYGKYLSVKNIMVLPGHPYMIHPSIGAAPGNPATVYINGVKKIEVGEGKEFATLAAVAESQKVERTVTSNEAGGTSTTAWKNPKTGKGGKYTFIGNINDDVNGDKGVQDMPTANGPVYFLGVKPGTVYPQFFKKKQGKGAKKWSQYSAIIVPDAEAIANVEGLDGMAVGSSAGDNSAKGYDVVFGEWEIVDEATVVTAIENAQAEAEETGKPAQITHMNVVYNIKGQVVRADSSSVEGLPKGLYIVNGKKYMVK